MRPLTAEGLLTAWERGQELAPAARALLLLSLAAPEASEEWLMSLTVGQRDAGLLTLRQWLFGSLPDMVTNRSSASVLMVRASA